jgi:uncharacterized protein UPF0158
VALPVSLEAVVQELEGLMDETTAFINHRTGELATVSHDELALAEDEEIEEADLPAWQVQMIPQLREIALGEDWTALPSKFDIHEWQIMSNFADRVEDAEVSERLQRAIRGRGAFRMFRDVVERAGIRESWFKFKHEALRKIARDALEERGIPYR